MPLADTVSAVGRGGVWQADAAAGIGKFLPHNATTRRIS
jgi:hypothetical protein